MNKEKRYVVDCRKSPGSNCTLALSGTESELLEAVVDHATHVHNKENSPQLKEEIKSWMEEEVPVHS